MEVSRALDQIAAIHDHLARTEVYRGSRSVPVAFSGVAAVVGWAVQPWLAPDPSPRAFVLWWVGIAAGCVAVVMTEIAWRYLARSSATARRTTRKTVGQFLPCLIAGALVTGLLSRAGAEAIALLPGLWAVLLGLGVFSARPYLPRAIGWVALYYLLAGAVLLWRAGPTGVPESWGMGATFGIGQWLAAAVLYWNVERRDDG